MIEIHGPTYRYQGEIIKSPELVFVVDHHYNEDEHCDHLARLLETSIGVPTVVFDHVLHQDIFDFPCVYFPRLLARESQEFNQAAIQPDWDNKTHAFNFMINKPRVHRNMLLSLIDEFGLTDYRHSLAWKNNPYSTIPVTDYRIGSEVVLDQGLKNGSYKNSLTYNMLLKTQVFEPTSISLITEPAFYEKETIVTEKTIMAIYGGTIPIWVGGWRIPDYMRSLGFDVFDDIVDHSYQDLNDPSERCRQSVIKNIDLLKHPIDLDQRRLQNNLELAKSNPWLAQINNLIKIYPDLRKVWPA